MIAPNNVIATIPFAICSQASINMQYSLHNNTMSNNTTENRESHLKKYIWALCTAINPQW